jgi:hypothetical protein
VTPEAWKTLISIFDVDPRTIRDVPTQVAAITSTYTGLKNDLQACDAKTGACDRQAGRGPGNPPCRNAAGAEMVVAEATIDRDGRILVAPGRDAAELQDKQPLGAEAFGVALSAASRASSRSRRRGGSDGGPDGPGDPGRSRAAALRAPHRSRHRDPCAAAIHRAGGRTAPEIRPTRPESGERRGDGAV